MSAAVIPNRVPALGIVNANTRTVQQQYVPVPNMRGTLANWFQAMTLTKIVKQQENYQIKETEISLTTRGILQPLSAQQLSMKPDGQRAWIWQMLHATIDLILIPDDIVIITGTRYRVSSKTDYKQYGYVQYDLYEDYLNPDAAR